MSWLADISSGAVGGLLGGIGTLAKDIRQAITGEISADKAAEIQLKLTEIENQAQQGQTLINIEEAKSGSLFVAGWRPFIGWICGIAVFYNYVGMPFLVWAAQLIWPTAPPMPALEIGELFTLLGGMLGLGYLRTLDKRTAPTTPVGKE